MESREVCVSVSSTRTTASKRKRRPLIDSSFAHTSDKEVNRIVESIRNRKDHCIASLPPHSSAPTPTTLPANRQDADTQYAARPAASPSRTRQAPPAAPDIALSQYRFPDRHLWLVVGQRQASNPVSLYPNASELRQLVQRDLPGSKKCL